MVGTCAFMGLPQFPSVSLRVLMDPLALVLSGHASLWSICPKQSLPIFSLQSLKRGCHGGYLHDRERS